ncbi:MAG: hypothetical protein ACK5PQ_02300 [Alphaproteobacteria bacterium]
MFHIWLSSLLFICFYHFNTQAASSSSALAAQFDSLSLSRKASSIYQPIPNEDIPYCQKQCSLPEGCQFPFLDQDTDPLNPIEFLLFIKTWEFQINPDVVERLLDSSPFFPLLTPEDILPFIGPFSDLHKILNPTASSEELEKHTPSSAENTSRWLLEQSHLINQHLRGLLRKDLLSDRSLEELEHVLSIGKTLDTIITHRKKLEQKIRPYKSQL